MLSGRLSVKWGDHLEEEVEIGPGDMVYVPPRETHILQNLSRRRAGGVRRRARLADGGLRRGPLGRLTPTERSVRRLSDELTARARRGHSHRPTQALTFVSRT